MTAAAVRRVRVAWGVVLLGAPRPVLRGVGRAGDRRAVVVLRVLGARHLGQSLLDAYGPRPAVGYLGAGIDGLHALTGVGLAVTAPRWRRAALIDCAVATTFAALTAITARRS